MASGQATTVVQHLRRIIGAEQTSKASDGWLLARFMHHRDETALAALVRRHGPLVWNVCRRVLPSFHDAEDAFQAVFLVFVRKAHTLDQPALLGNWLYGVACRTARKARAMHAKQLTAALDGQEPAAHEASTESGWRELRPVLDEELSRLPEKYRVPLVLCYLEGQTHEGAAERLGWPKGTVSGRLARGRDLLRRRLTRRGITLPASLVGVLMMQHAASAAAPPALMHATIHAAAAVAAGQVAAALVSTKVAALTEGVLHAMWFSKLKTVLFASSLAMVMALGAAALVAPALGQKSDKPPAAAKPGAAEKQSAAKPEKKAPGPTVRGVVLAVDATKQTITVRVPLAESKRTEEKSFALAKDVKVVLEDVLEKVPSLPVGKLGDLTEGTLVTLHLDAEGKAIVEISARGPGLSGRVSAVDAAQNRLTISTKHSGGPMEHVLTLAPGAKVLRNDGLTKGDKDHEGKLADLTEGTHVLVQVSVDRRLALSVRVQGANVIGRLKGYDAANNSLTVTVKEDGGPVDKTYPVAKNARLLDLTEGSPVTLRLSVLNKDTVVAAQGLKDK